MTDEELIEEREPLGGLVPVGEPRLEKRSVVWTLSFPPQDHRIDTDSDVSDPRTREGAGAVVAVDEASRTLELKRGPKLAGTPLPTALVPRGVIPTTELAESLLRTGEQVAARGFGGDATEPGAADLGSAGALLVRPRPGTSGGGEPLVHAGETPLQAAVRLAPGLAGRILPVQGPPGSGKTHTGAHMIVALAMQGKRVGVVANSHKVIGNLLRKVDTVTGEHLAAGRLERAVRIGQKPKTGQRPTFAGADLLPDNASVARALRAGAVDVVGAVAWTWCRPEMALPEPVLDVLFVDEAGQLSLANVLACAPAARAIVLLGDPQQLDQPTQGSHPPGAERSALGHVLGDRATIDPAEGLFLGETWRLHPDICGFTSSAFYEDRLRPVAGLERQGVHGTAVLSGTGLRHAAVEHRGNATDSPEEADAIVGLVRELLDGGAAWTDLHDDTHALTLDDVVIVAPYNAHVAAIERAFARAGLGAPFVGTVDKFQGQERPISIYAMGTSAPEDAPRGMEFLYSLNRLNVATSRARCVAAIVCSPALLRVACRTPRQMELANGLCLAIEAAEEHARRSSRAPAAEVPPMPLLLFPDLGEERRGRGRA
jgi:RecA/RadA recombinase